MIAKGKTVLLISMITVSSLAAGELQVICPTQEVRVKEGENVDLLCHLDQQVDLTEDTVDWTKLDSGETVHVFRKGQDDPGPQSPRFRGRTTLNHEGLKTGNLTLHISSVKQSDNGTYNCFIPMWTMSCTVVLLIGELQVICPTQEVRAKEGENVDLLCHLDRQVDLSEDTLNWTKLDSGETVHLYRRRQDYPGPQSPRFRGRTTLNHEGLKTGNLTLHISSVKQSDNGTYRCVVSKKTKSCTVVLLVDGAQKEAVWNAITVAVVAAAVVAAAVVLVVVVLCILVNSGNIKICKKFREMNEQEAKKANDGKMGKRLTQTGRCSRESVV